MVLCKLEECNPANLELLKTYEMIMISNGKTERSIEAFCKHEVPLFFRYIKDKSVHDITHHDVSDFLYYCLKERKNGAAALNRKRTALNSFFSQLIRKDHLDIKNPIDKIDKVQERPIMREPLTYEEMQKIFRYIDENNKLRAGATYSLFYSSGCRISELWQQNRDSPDFANRTFVVLGKGGKTRRCIFSEDARDRTLRYLESRKDDLPALFISRQNNRLSKESMRDEMKKIAVAAGVKKNVFPHRIRHTSGDHMRKSGAKIEDIQLFLGHEDPGTTAKIYARGDLLEIREQFDEVLTVNY